MSTKRILSALSGGRRAFHLCVSEVQPTDGTVFFKQQTWSNFLGKFSNLSKAQFFCLQNGHSTSTYLQDAWHMVGTQ